MQIQTNTDHTIEGTEALTTHVETVVNLAVGRFSENITRVVVHLNKTNDAKSATGDFRCLLEARIEGHAPVAASDHAGNLHQAIHGAAEKLKRAIGSTLGRLNDGIKGGPVVTDAIVDDRDSSDEDTDATTQRAR
ncbi:MAG: HPF/RaiA family ribosome-associated protein [Herminiimonas sp.]|nr:HPF/RaiA family ribosome-associated protein [Herminiimonas sp.]